MSDPERKAQLSHSKTSDLTQVQTRQAKSAAGRTPPPQSDTTTATRVKLSSCSIRDSASSFECWLTSQTGLH
jgi:hypothetical protein